MVVRKMDTLLSWLIAGLTNCAGTRTWALGKGLSCLPFVFNS